MVSLIVTLANHIYLKDISEKWTKKTKATKRIIILSTSSTELTKLKSLIKFHDQPVVLSSWSLESKPPQPEPQLQLYEIWSNVNKLVNAMVVGLRLIKQVKGVYFRR